MDDNEALVWDARLKKAADLGAQAALARIGLSDADAARDVDEFRSVMSSWRALKQEAYRTLIHWFVMGIIAAIVFTISPKFSYLLKGN